MKSNIPLLSHIELAHLVWKKHLKKNSIIIDATCGNGHDSLFLAKNLQEGTLFCFDVQKQALLQTQKNLCKNIFYIHDCHSNLEKCHSYPVDLIIYNLGYLPGSNKKIRTGHRTTLISLKKASKMLMLAMQTIYTLTSSVQMLACTQRN